jgi:Holliday junction resolvase
MALTPEAKVKKKVKEILDQMGVYHFSPMQNGMGRAGIPDIIGCLEGQFLGIECKAGRGTTTALQERELTKIQNAGGYALVVNEENINQLWEIKEWITTNKN